MRTANEPDSNDIRGALIPRASIECYRPARIFFRGMVRLVVEHLRLRASAAPAFLAANLFAFGNLSGHEALLLRLDLIKQQSASEEAVETLLPGFLAFHVD